LTNQRVPGGMLFWHRVDQKDALKAVNGSAGRVIERGYLFWAARRYQNGPVFAALQESLD
jgi:hypothetical protein